MPAPRKFDVDIKPATLRNWIEAEERAAAPSEVGGDDSVDTVEVRRVGAHNSAGYATRTTR